MKSKPLQDMLDHLALAPARECDLAALIKLKVIAGDPDSTPEQLLEWLNVAVHCGLCSDFMVVVTDATIKLWKVEHQITSGLSAS